MTIYLQEDSGMEAEIGPAVGDKAPECVVMAQPSMEEVGEGCAVGGTTLPECVDDKKTVVEDFKMESVTPAPEDEAHNNGESMELGKVATLAGEQDSTPVAVGNSKLMTTAVTIPSAPKDEASNNRESMELDKVTTLNEEQDPIPVDSTGIGEKHIETKPQETTNDKSHEPTPMDQEDPSLHPLFPKEDSMNGVLENGSTGQPVVDREENDTTSTAPNGINGGQEKESTEHLQGASSSCTPEPIPMEQSSSSASSSSRDTTPEAAGVLTDAMVDEERRLKERESRESSMDGEVCC